MHICNHSRRICNISGLLYDGSVAYGVIGFPCAITVWGFFIARPGGYEGSLEEDMAKDITERVRKAQDKVLECLDYILETIPHWILLRSLDMLAVMWALSGYMMTALYMRNEQGGI